MEDFKDEANSPFEKAQLATKVLDKQKESGKDADYELTNGKNGLTTERFETFAVERIK